MSETYKEKYNEWKESPIIDEETKKELKSIENDEKEIEDRFYKDLEFGTGGLRGVMGAGTNRMNLYTVRKATQGLANYICSRDGQAKGVVIAYDSRNNSKLFSKEAALVLNANGIKTYLFKNLRPTPELSFAVRELKAIAGIVITASHNPPEYNGYKVYFEDGGQIVPPHDKLIISEVNKITDLSEIKTISEEEAKKANLYNEIEEEIDNRFIEELKKLILNADIIKEYGSKLKVVYTPLHGTGGTLAPRILKEIGLENLYVVPEQAEPNGDFPTVSYPNPEDPKAFELALKLANEVNADVVLATDPDADRLGVYAKDSKTGKYQSFTGNMSGLLIAEYILSQRKEKNILPENGALVKTIVSSNMAVDIAKEYNLHLVEVLTGFKYIGEQIKLFEENNSYKYLFGYEESYGCLLGTYARDKDGIAAVMALCEVACFAKKQNKTLCDLMNEMYEKYGYYKEDLAFFTLKGIDGTQKIKNTMENLRSSIIKNIGSEKVIAVRDYSVSVRCDLESGLEENINIPKSNVLYYELENNGWVCVRPSGTEPKIKLYMGIKEKNAENAEIKLENLKAEALNLLKGNM
jgi:phosphoglucomutase